MLILEKQKVLMAGAEVSSEVGKSTINEPKFVMIVMKSAEVWAVYVYVDDGENAWRSVWG